MYIQDWAILNLSNLKWVLGANTDPNAPPPEPVNRDNRNIALTFDEERHHWKSSGWLCGVLPCARAGVAVASGGGGDGPEAVLFGGAQYVANSWFRDMFELRFGNLSDEDAPPLAPDTEVLVHGLKSRPDINGSTGTIVQRVEDSSRYAVETQEYGMLSILPNNLDVLPDEDDEWSSS